MTLLQNPAASQATLNNWLNSYLSGKITYGDGKNGSTEYTVIFDSVLNIVGQPGNFLLANCPKNAKNAKGKDISCRKNKMQIMEIGNLQCDKDFNQTTLDNATLNMRICEDSLQFGGQQDNKTKLLLVDGEKFNQFDGILNSGAPKSPKADGVFSLAYSDDSYKLLSGAQYLVTGKQEQPVVSIYMQKFDKLDPLSGTKGTLNFGLVNSENCVQWGQPQSIVEGARRWKISMEAEKILNETAETFKDQEALISTTDIFMFAPENFTRDILDKLKPSPKDVMVQCPSAKELEQLPTIKFTFGENGKSFEFKPNEYIMPLVTPKMFGKNFKVFNWCHVLIRHRPDPAMLARNLLPENNQNQWILGQAFYNKACVAFNYKDSTVSLAEAWTQEN
uniref:Peptidase A1 domain-containing protein n=1 Tax=Meloidogyne javanica TaxID=6303 RepID=A0A915LWJ6_MELJA